MTDAHERTHEEGSGDVIARAVRAWHKDRTPTTHDALETLLRERPPSDDDPLELLVEAMRSGPDGENEGIPRDFEHEHRAALRFLAENRPLNTHTPPDYPTANEREWIVRQWLPRGRFTLFTGPGGKGKSRIALQLASAFAAGERDWLGDMKEDNPLLIEGGGEPVVFASYEDEPEEVWRRLEVIQSAMGPRPPRGRFTLVDLVGYGALWGPPSA